MTKRNLLSSVLPQHWIDNIRFLIYFKESQNHFKEIMPNKSFIFNLFFSYAKKPMDLKEALSSFLLKKLTTNGQHEGKKKNHLRALPYRL